MRFFFIILLLVSNISLAQITDVTFSVDMSNQTISEKGVHLAGDFQDWDPSSLEMFDIDSDSIYQITISLEIDSVYEYKFINGDSWGEDENIDEECGNGNRILITSNESTNLETVCFSSCYSCDYVPETVEVTFQVDMTGYEVSDQGVHLAGSFQDWIPSTTQMYDLDNDSIYSLTLSLLTNTSYEY